MLKKYITAILLFFPAIFFLCTDCLSAAPAYTNEASGYTAQIDDQADLLTDSEEKDLLEKMKPITEYGNVAFASIDSNPYSSTRRYAESYTDEHFGRSNGTLFLINMDQREIYIDTKGSIRKELTSSYANTITDNVYGYASYDDFYTCAYEAFDQIYSLLEGKRIAQPMKYISNALLAFILAMLILYFIVMAVSKKRKAGTGELLSGIYHNFRFNNPQIVYDHQTKQYSPRSSGSSGSHSGGGGGHSSGGHSGGGGGHSGGGHRF